MIGCSTCSLRTSPACTQSVLCSHYAAQILSQTQSNVPKKLSDKHPARPLPILSSTEGSVMSQHPTGDCRSEIEFVGESSFCILIQVYYLSRERVERGGGIGWCRSFALALAFPPSLCHFFFLSRSLSWLVIRGHHFYISPLHLTLMVYLYFLGRANSEPYSEPEKLPYIPNNVEDSWSFASSV